MEETRLDLNIWQYYYYGCCHICLDIFVLLVSLKASSIFLNISFLLWKPTRLHTHLVFNQEPFGLSLVFGKFQKQIYLKCNLFSFCSWIYLQQLSQKVLLYEFWLKILCVCRPFNKVFGLSNVHKPGVLPTFFLLYLRFLKNACRSGLVTCFIRFSKKNYFFVACAVVNVCN